VTVVGDNCVFCAPLHRIYSRFCPFDEAKVILVCGDEFIPHIVFMLETDSYFQDVILSKLHPESNDAYPST
jgi:hypothetical protein